MVQTSYQRYFKYLYCIAVLLLIQCFNYTSFFGKQLRSQHLDRHDDHDSKNDRLIDSTSDKLHSTDFLSPIAIKLLADVHYGNLPIPKDYIPVVKKLTRKNALILTWGSVVFVDSLYIPRFYFKVLPYIWQPFVLVTGDSDYTVPNILNSTDVLKLVNDRRLLHWYAMNCGYIPHPTKFTCLPNGISQWGSQVSSLEKIYESGTIGIRNDNRMMRPKSSKGKKLSVLASFNLETNPLVRKPVFDHFCSRESILQSISTCHYDNTTDQLGYYRKMSDFMFVISPIGAGLDCYRTYEAMYLGSYPVVKTSSLDSIFRDLPVLIVNDWTDVTPRLLNDTFHRYESTRFNYDRIFQKYWSRQFRSHSIFS